MRPLQAFATAVLVLDAADWLRSPKSVFWCALAYLILDEVAHVAIDLMEGAAKRRADRHRATS